MILSRRSQTSKGTNCLIPGQTSLCSQRSGQQSPSGRRGLVTGWRHRGTSWRLGRFCFLFCVLLTHKCNRSLQFCKSIERYTCNICTFLYVCCPSRKCVRKYPSFHRVGGPTREEWFLGQGAQEKLPRRGDKAFFFTCKSFSLEDECRRCSERVEVQKQAQRGCNCKGSITKSQWPRERSLLLECLHLRSFSPSCSPVWTWEVELERMRWHLCSRMLPPAAGQ